MRPNAVERTLTAGGMAAAVVFIGGSVLEGVVRPGYDARTEFVSELAIGDDGWVQDANFLVSGVLVALFAVGLRREEARLRTGRAVPALLLALAVALAGSAFFVTDPSTLFSPRTGHGLVHSLLGAAAFLCMPAICLAAAHSADRLGDRPWRGLSVAADAALVAGIMLLKVSELPDGGLFAWKGLVQRAELVVFFGWLFAFSLLVTRASRAPRSPEGNGDG